MLIGERSFVTIVLFSFFPSGKSSWSFQIMAVDNLIIQIWNQNILLVDIHTVEQDQSTLLIIKHPLSNGSRQTAVSALAGSKISLIPAGKKRFLIRDCEKKASNTHNVRVMPRRWVLKLYLEVTYFLFFHCSNSIFWDS